jgi:hypothetical protein
MATASVSRKIHGKLQALHRAVMRWLFVKGLALLLVVVVLMLAAELFIDWYWQMDKMQRGICMGGIVLVAGYLLFVKLFKPMLQQLPIDSLALRVEAKHQTELKQSLITALQFARVDDPSAQGVSGQMLEAAIEQGNVAAANVPFGDVIDSKAFKRNTAVVSLMVVVIGFGVYGVFATDLLGAWFDRNFAFGDERYPRQTHFVLDEDKQWIVPRGDDWQPIIKVTGVIPDSVYIDFEPLEGSDITQQMTRLELPSSKPNVSSEQTPKPVAKPDAKTDVKPEVKPTVKPEIKSEVKPATDGCVDEPEATGSAGKTDKADESVASDKEAGASQEAVKKQTDVDKKKDATGNDSASASQTSVPVAEFTATFKEVLQPFRFRVRGGDARSDWINVTLVDRPRVESFQLSIEWPKYTGKGTQRVWSIESAKGRSRKTGDDDNADRATHSGSSSLYALKGSAIHFQAATNKPLKSATLTVGKSVYSLTIASSNKNEGVAGATSTFTGHIPADKLVSGTYVIDMVDQQDLQPRKSQKTRFNVRVKADRDPSVKAELVGISSMIVPEARIPIKAFLRDDFQIVSTDVVFNWNGETEDSPSGKGRLPFGLKYAELDFTKSKPDPHVVQFEVGPHNVPIGSSLSFFVEAKDNDAIAGGKKGVSSTFFVRVVDEQELRDDLLRREQEQRQEFMRLMATQDKLIDESRIMISTGDVENEASASLRQRLIQLEKRQKLAGDRCISIARQYAKLSIEFENNKLEEAGSPVQRRLNNKIIDPLNNIADRSSPNAVSLVEQARKATQPEQRKDLLQDAHNAQLRVSGEMREVLKYMVKWNNYQEAVNMVYGLLKEQGGVNRDTLRAHQARLRAIFGGDKKDDKKKDK